MTTAAKKAWIIWFAVLLIILVAFSCGSKSQKIIEKVVVNERIIDSIKTDSFKRATERIRIEEIREKYNNFDTSQSEKSENFTTSTIDFDALEHEVLEIDTPEGKTTIKGTGKVNITTQSSRVTMKELAIELGETKREFYLKEQEHIQEMKLLTSSIYEKETEIDLQKELVKKRSSFLKYSLIANAILLVLVLLLIYLWYRKKRREILNSIL